MVDWTDYEDMEEEFVEKESRLPKSKPPKKSWKQIQEDKRRSTNKKQWQKKRRKGSLEKKNIKRNNS